MKLYNIFEKLILENVNRAEVIKAIDTRYRVNIDYMGDDETEPGKRTIEVYAFGMSKSGNLVIRAYQGFGKTTTVIPGWKMFRLDRINSWQPINVTKGIFNSPISDRTNVPPFNPNGDREMTTVYKVAQFNNNNNPQINKDNEHNTPTNSSNGQPPISNARRGQEGDAEGRNR